MYISLATTLSPDGRWLALGALPYDNYDAGGPLVLWDTAAERMIRQRMIAPGGIGLEGNRLLAFSPSGALLLAHVDTNALMILDSSLSTVGKVAVSIDDSSPGAGWLGDAAVVTVGEKGLAIASTRGTVRWLACPQATVIGCRGADVAILTDDTRIFGVEIASGTVRWTGQAVPRSSDSYVGVSPDGETVAIGDNGAIVFLDTVNGQVTAQGMIARSRVGSIIWARNSRRVAVVTEVADPEIAIFEGTTPLARLRLRARTSPWLMAPDLASFAFSLDASRGAVATDDGNVVIVELGATPREIARQHLVDDDREWLGLYWGAGETVVAITSREIVSIDGATGAVRSRAALPFAIRRDA